MVVDYWCGVCTIPEADLNSASDCVSRRKRVANLAVLLERRASTRGGATPEAFIKCDAGMAWPAFGYEFIAADDAVRFWPLAHPSHALSLWRAAPPQSSRSFALLLPLWFHQGAGVRLPNAEAPSTSPPLTIRPRPVSRVTMARSLTRLKALICKYTTVSALLYATMVIVPRRSMPTSKQNPGLHKLEFLFHCI